MWARPKLDLSLVVWIVGGCALAALGVATGSWIWFVPLAALFVGTAVFAMSIRCGTCRYPVLKRERKTAIGHLTVWVPVVPSNCPECGRRLVAGWPKDDAA